MGQRVRIRQNVTVNTYNFKTVDHFKYLEATITADYNVAEEITGRLKSTIRPLTNIAWNQCGNPRAL